MVVEKAALVEGKKDCEHKFVTTSKEWDEVVVSTDDPEKRKQNSWHYAGITDKCEKCGREELCGGTILVPEGGGFMGGEYTLEPDGSRGYFIG